MPIFDFQSRPSSLNKLLCKLHFCAFCCLLIFLEKKLFSQIGCIFCRENEQLFESIFILNGQTTGWWTFFGKKTVYLDQTEGLVRGSDATGSSSAQENRSTTVFNLRKTFLSSFNEELKSRHGYLSCFFLFRSSCASSYHSVVVSSSPRLPSSAFHA